MLEKERKNQEEAELKERERKEREETKKRKEEEQRRRSEERAKKAELKAKQKAQKVEERTRKAKERESKASTGRKRTGGGDEQSIRHTKCARTDRCSANEINQNECCVCFINYDNDLSTGSNAHVDDGYTRNVQTIAWSMMRGRSDYA